MQMMVEHGTFLVSTTYLTDCLDVSKQAPEKRAKAAEVFPQAKAMLPEGDRRRREDRVRHRRALRSRTARTPRSSCAMVERGMTPMQAIQAATVMSAELIDRADDLRPARAGLPRRHHRGARRPVRRHRVVADVRFVMKDGVGPQAGRREPERGESALHDL